MQQQRDAWFAGKSCVDCGTTCDLQLDHVDRSTKVSHRIWSWSRVRREAELAKCVARCRPCHEAKGRQVGDLGVVKKLTPDEVEQIRREYSGGALQRELAVRYGVAQQHISKLVLGQRRI